jgi:hypothetical protein
VAEVSRLRSLVVSRQELLSDAATSPIRSTAQSTDALRRFATMMLAPHR